MMMSHQKKVHGMLCLALCLLFLLGLSSTAVAELRQIQWQAIRQTLNCDGLEIKIDAVTDSDIPATVNEWRTEGRVWTEKELRQLVAIASPGDENMKRHPHNLNDDISLYDDILVTSANSHLGSVTVQHHVRADKYGYATSTVNKIFYYHFEPFNEPVPMLSQINYEQVLTSLTPLLDAFNCEIGEPVQIEAWNQSTLQDNWDWSKNLFPELYGDRTWTEEEECYKITFPVYFEGIRLNQGTRLNVDGDPERGSFDIIEAALDIWVDSSGLLYLQMSDGCMTNAKALSQPQEVLSVTQAIECYRQMRSTMFLPDEEPFTISKIMLQYLVIKDAPSDKAAYRLVPVWCFYHERGFDDWEDALGFDLVFEMIHAVTGKPVDY